MTAVVLVGGRGRRLKPYTDILPKPLLPLAGEPILAHLLRQLQRSGFTRVVLAAGYLSHLLEAYFGDGSAYGVELSYLREIEPLGTAGPLTLVSTSEPLLVVNGDLITTIPFAQVMAFHEQYEADLTVVAKRIRYRLPFGKLTAAQGRLQALEEKPYVTFLVSAGVYVLAPAVLADIPRCRPSDMPELVSRYLRADRPVACFVTTAYWRDVGTAEAFRDAVRHEARLARMLEVPSAPSPAVHPASGSRNTVSGPKHLYGPQ